MENVTQIITTSKLFNENGELLTTYMGVDLICRITNSEKVYITPDILSYNLGVKEELFFKNLDVLCQKGYLTKIKTNRYYADKYKYTHLDCKFVKIKKETLLKLLNSNKRNKYDLIRFLLIVMSTFDFNIQINNVKNIVGHMPQAYLAEISNIHKNTVSSYFTTLEELGILYIHHGGMHEANLYGLKEHELLIKQFVNSTDKHNRSNFHRSVSLRYNAFINNTKHFTREEVEQLYKDCKQYNIDMDELQALQPGSDYVSKKKLLDKITFLGVR